MRGVARSESASGTTRAGRRPRPVPAQRSFVDRYRSRIIGFGIIAAVAVFAVLVFVGSTSSVYACSIQLDPASPAPSPSGVNGQREDDQGRGHVVVGTQVTYTFCPPASGKHYSASGQGPIAPRYYGPDDTAIPQGWVHNLEHGGMVILYNCARNGCDTNSQTTLKQLIGKFPASPVCKIAGGLLSPVIARFDQMKANFAAVVWDRVLFQDTLDVSAMLEFFQNQGEKNNPERQCNPSPSPGESATTNPNPLAPESEVPGVQPVPSESGSGEPASAVPSASEAPSASPVPSGT
jgi:hypothetical protein